MQYCKQLGLLFRVLFYNDLLAVIYRRFAFSQVGMSYPLVVYGNAPPRSFCWNTPTLYNIFAEVFIFMLDFYVTIFLADYTHALYFMMEGRQHPWLLKKTRNTHHLQ